DNSKAIPSFRQPVRLFGSHSAPPRTTLSGGGGELTEVCAIDLRRSQKKYQRCEDEVGHRKQKWHADDDRRNANYQEHDVPLTPERVRLGQDSPAQKPRGGLFHRGRPAHGKFLLSLPPPITPPRTGRGNPHPPPRLSTDRMRA